MEAEYCDSAGWIYKRFGVNSSCFSYTKLKWKTEKMRMRRVFLLLLFSMFFGCSVKHEQTHVMPTGHEIRNAPNGEKHLEQLINARKEKYKLTQRIDKLTHVTPKQKLIAWNRFIRFLSRENVPNSKYEKDMRYYAAMRIEYWESLVSEPNEHGHIKYSKAKEIGRDGQFIAYSNGVIYDEKNGLEWFIGPDKNITWGDASSWVSGLSVLGGGWHMPSRKELKTLFKKDAAHSITPLIKTTGWWVWASEHDGSSSAWYFNFSRGYASWSSQLYSDGERVFAVRTCK